MVHFISPAVNFQGCLKKFSGKTYNWRIWDPGHEFYQNTKRLLKFKISF